MKTLGSLLWAVPPEKKAIHIYFCSLALFDNHKLPQSHLQSAERPVKVHYQHCSV